MTQAEIQKQTEMKTKNAQSQSRNKVAAANKKIEMEQYGKLRPQDRKNWSGDELVAKDYQIQEMVKRLRQQFPDLSEQELIELAKVQLGFIDSGSPGRAQPIQEPSRGTPYGAQSYPQEALDPRTGRPRMTKWAGYTPSGPSAGAMPVQSDGTFPIHGGQPYAPQSTGGVLGSSKPAAPGGAVCSTIGGSKVCYPASVAADAQAKRDYEQEKRALELEAARQNLLEQQSAEQIRRRKDELALKQLQDQMEYDAWIRSMERGQQSAQQPPALSGLMSQDGQRRPVTFQR